MKKIIIFLAVIIVLFAGIAIVTKMQTSEKVEGNPYGKSSLHPETVKQLEDENYQNIILPEDLEKKLDAKEDAVVYFFSPTCHYCVEATPHIMSAAKKAGVNIDQFNLLEFEDGWEQYHIENTPTIVVYEKGKEKNRFVGSSEKGEPAYVEFFEDNVK